ncbi:unnamed protein product, partial [Angiostrongylus costaricensis]|uniref:PHM7_cyt domain-containing protein n=1 Tax=Angiostrongylus costaricensis TaxID=334426 RepID=A0A0R3PDA4_ANGCS
VKQYTNFTILICLSAERLIFPKPTVLLGFQVKSCVLNKRVNPELLRLGNEIKRLKAELATISPTSEFSAYFKTERILKKAGEQYEAAESRSWEPLAEYGQRHVVACYFILTLLAFCIPGVAFWPINILLRFPSVWSSDQCGGEGKLYVPFLNIRRASYKI